LKKEVRAGVSTIFEYLGGYGLFLVPVGNVEGWLKTLNVKKTKTDWLIKILSKMGTNEHADDYVKPSNDDVWDFLD
jgi:hypothetical protein